MAKKQLSYEFKVAARTTPEIHEAISTLVMKAGNRGIKFRGRKLGVEAAINALLIDFLEKPDEERMRLLSVGVSRFEEMLGDEQEPPLTASRPIPRSSGSIVVDDSRPVEPKRRKKSG